MLSDRRRLCESSASRPGRRATSRFSWSRTSRACGSACSSIASVLERLARRDPLPSLDEDNLRRLLHGARRRQPLPLPGLEPDARPQRVAARARAAGRGRQVRECAMALLTRAAGRMFSARRCMRGCFDAVSFLPQLDEISRRRYEEANRHAARFCRSLDERFLRAARAAPGALAGASCAVLPLRTSGEDPQPGSVRLIATGASTVRRFILRGRLLARLRFASSHFDSSRRSRLLLAVCFFAAGRSRTGCSRRAGLCGLSRIGAFAGGSSSTIDRPGCASARLARRLALLAVLDQAIVVPGVDGVAAIVECDLPRFRLRARLPTVRGRMRKPSFFSSSFNAPSPLNRIGSARLYVADRATLCVRCFTRARSSRGIIELRHSSRRQVRKV